MAKLCKKTAARGTQTVWNVSGHAINDTLINELEIYRSKILIENKSTNGREVTCKCTTKQNGSETLSICTTLQ
jgi:hypothetical protein